MPAQADMPARLPAAGPAALPAASSAAGSAWRGIRRWSVAVTVYLMAVFNRTSIGVAGLLAAQRFGISPAQLSVFVLVQLGVYAAMQVPTGIMLDKFGPRRMLAVAGVTMALAQLIFAVAPSYQAALLARTILGCGDAMTYISVLRVGSSHFAQRRFPLVIAATGLLGTVGNLAATLPLVLLLRTEGWTATFATASAVSLLTGIAVWLMLPATPAPASLATPAPASLGSSAAASPASSALVTLTGPTGPVRRAAVRAASSLRAISAGGAVRAIRGTTVAARQIAGQVRAAWRTPGTRLGFWVHFAGLSFTGMFGFLWGMPYLESAGYPAASASEVLLLGVTVSMAAGPAIGFLIGRHPAARVPFAIAVYTLTVAGWVLLLAGYDGAPPHALIVTVVAITTIGGPSSSIGFALARDYNSPASVGTASGVVNVGGFTAAVVATLVVGWALTASRHTSAAAFRPGFAIAITIQAIGTIQTVRWWLQVRAQQLQAQSRGERVPVPVVRRPFDLVRAADG